MERYFPGDHVLDWAAAVVATSRYKKDTNVMVHVFAAVIAVVVLQKTGGGGAALCGLVNENKK